ncbi:cupin domain-containing protein [Cyclobacterium sp. SYSU L10401]|uniref:cupin domain-containing protein n=1 Tax=Cyclobacterium sp. SYSU L10401 TaxID=2678657 RepID=UPI0013D05CB2|nr:cupin domain-containing protein [Cyclobacterium sp. SYSU L10401]
MKYLLGLPMLFLCITLMGQVQNSQESNEKVLIDNDKVKVFEHSSLPKGEVCGEGMHHHEPHLTVILTDAKVQITPDNGKPQVIEVKSRTSMWFESETHSVINKGDKPTKMVLVYLKE